MIGMKDVSGRTYWHFFVYFFADLVYSNNICAFIKECIRVTGMTCKEFEKMIPDFLNRKLDFLTLKKFNEHMESCEECREELTIQFLVTEGMQRLEEGNAFDMQAELEDRLEEARNHTRFHSAFLYVGAALETLAIALIAAFVIWMLV